MDIPLEEAKPGMKTELAVMWQGMVLIGAGIELTEKMLAKLESLGINEIAVQGVLSTKKANEKQDPARNEAYEKIAAEFDYIFRNVDRRSDIMAEIKRVALDRATKNI